MDNRHREMAPPEQPESSRGAGGKMRKAPNRKSRATPYARPPPNHQSQTPLAVRGGNGGWLSKLVDPACRLIGAGATRLLPSLFSRSPLAESPSSSSSDEEHDEQGEAEHGEDDGSDQENLDLALTRATQSANAETIEDDLNCGGPSDAKRKDKSTDLPNVDQLSEIEQMIKGKMLSRGDVDRLMEILHSKTVDLPDDEGRDKQPAVSIREEIRGPEKAPELASKLREEKQEVLTSVSREFFTPISRSNLQHEISASPVDIARAYMGRRMSEISSSSVATPTGNDGALDRFGGYISKPFISSPSHNSSVRWPGAMGPDRYLTPQTQRNRYGLHDFRRSPYSRSIHSMTKSKLIQIGDNGNKYSETQSPILKQSQTVVNQEARSRSNILDGFHGSVGAVRRARYKFGIGTRKFDNIPPLAGTSRRDNTNLPSTSWPTFGKNMDAGGIGNTADPQFSDDRPQSLDIRVPTVPTHSSQMARKILDHLDRNFPTPKEKSAELKLATSWQKHIPSDSATIADAAVSRENMEKHGNASAASQHESRGTSLFKLPPERNTIRIAEPVGRKTSIFDADLRSSIPASGTNSEVANEASKIPSAAMVSQPQDTIKKAPLSAAKVALPSITIQKPELRPAFSSGSSSGFTFPVYASPEPPTPSLVPPPSLTNSHHHMPNEEASVPLFSFGSNRSSPPIVFSFPSTSSSPFSSNAADLNFTFGSGERRISFASIGRDGLCC